LDGPETARRVASGSDRVKGLSEVADTCGAVDTAGEERRLGHEALDTLRAAFPPEWREAPLGWEGVAAWEKANGVVLPEPYRSFVAEIANGSSLGPAEDGGLLPLGWLPPGWPDLGDRDVTAPFPLEAAWAWEDEDNAEGDVEERSDAVYNHGSIVLGAEDGPMYWCRRRVK
jgi:hypothetical protein